MSTTKINTIANFIGQTWAALIGFILVPVYIKYLGIESFGLLGFFISLQALVAVMDFGLSTAANREVARSTTGAHPADNLREILSTLQYIYIGIAGLLIIVFLAGAEFIATKWVVAGKLSNETIRDSIIIFGITLGLRWPIALYSGILRGYEKQVRLNIITIIVATLRGGGSAILVIFISQDIKHLLLWQLIAAIIEVIAFMVVSWHVVPGVNVRLYTFNIKALKQVIGFSTAVAFISISAALTKQLDKVIISKLLPLEEMGYYATAIQAFMVVQIVITPISAAVFPRLSSIMSMGDESKLADVYHSTTKIIAFIVAPIAAILIYYSHDILLLWTNSKVVSDNSYLALSLLAVAAMFNSVMQASYILQLAAGLQKIALLYNILACIIFAPLTYFLVVKYGINGGALSWVIYNLLYFSIMPHVTHRYILRKHLGRWFLNDTIPYMLLSTIIFWLLYVSTNEFSIIVKIVMGVTAIIIYTTVVCFFDKCIRRQFVELIAMFNITRYT